MTLRCNLIDYGEGDKKVKVVRGVRKKLKVVMIGLTLLKLRLKYTVSQLKFYKNCESYELGQNDSLYDFM